MHLCAFGKIRRNFDVGLGQVAYAGFVGLSRVVLCDLSKLWRNAHLHAFFSLRAITHNLHMHSIKPPQPINILEKIVIDFQNMLIH